MTYPSPQQPSWLTEEAVRAVTREYGTPTYVYSMPLLVEQARAALAFPNPFGLTVRYAMKACPNAAVIRALVDAGLHLDATRLRQQHVNDLLGGTVAEQLAVVTLVIGDVVLFHQGDEIPRGEALEGRDAKARIFR